ncbi:MAG TPA: hypothetical protein VIL20_16005, partial [Sandaracinaceae bacterium]
ITETVYVLRRTMVTYDDGEPGERTEVFKDLYAIDPGGGAPRHVADVSDLDDLRMLFPRDQVLLMGERNGRDVLRVLDPSTGALVREVETAARYHGTRLSPSGRFVAVADNAASGVPIHLIDTETYEIVAVPHDGVWLEVMWANDRDVLVAMIDYQLSWSLEEPDPEAARMRFVAWDVAQLAATGFPTDAGLFASPIFDFLVDGVTRDSAFSFSWVGLDPQDRYAVFPVRSYRPEDPATEGPGGYEGWHADLLVVEIATGAARRVDNAFGPVGFTPDGSTIVSYGYVEQVDEEGHRTLDPRLVMIDVTTLGAESLEIPIEGGPSFFVTREGNWVVVASALGTEQLVLYDVDAGAMTRVSGEPIGLFEFVSRPGVPELWLVDDGALHRLDLMSATLERIDVGGRVDRINILPRRDELVLGTRDGGTITFFAPAERRTLRTVMLPRRDGRG